MHIYPIAYWPPIEYIQSIMNGEALIEINENYQKRSIRNKTTILTSQGPKTLSVPLSKGKNHNLNIGMVTISYDEPWQKRHVDSIKNAYRNAPYYRYYIDSVSDLIRSKEHNLLRYNSAIIEWILLTFTDNKALKVTSEYLGVKYIGKNDIKPYRQVYEKRLGFVKENLSILDLIFNVGYEIPLYFNHHHKAKQPY